MFDAEMESTVSKPSPTFWIITIYCEAQSLLFRFWYYYNHLNKHSNFCLHFKLWQVLISYKKCLYRVLYTILPIPHTAYMSGHRAGAGCVLRNPSYLWSTLLTCYGFCGILWSLARQCKWANCLQSCVSMDTNCHTLHSSYVALTWAAVICTVPKCQEWNLTRVCVCKGASK